MTLFLSFIPNGILFYNVEYLYFLKENGYEVELIVFLNPKKGKSKELFFTLLRDKYSKEAISYIENSIKFYNLKERGLIKREYGIILDQFTLRYLNKKFFIKKAIINFNIVQDDILYSKNIYTLQKKRINFFDAILKCGYDIPSKNKIIFGNPDFPIQIDFPHLLSLNFKMFKKIDTFQNNTFFENKNTFKSTTRGIQNFKDNFHSNFNKLKFIELERLERANRLIPECKFYNKEIDFIPASKESDPLSLNTSKKRAKESWRASDINSPENSKSFLNIIKAFYE